MATLNWEYNNEDTLLTLLNSLYYVIFPSVRIFALKIKHETASKPEQSADDLNLCTTFASLIHIFFKLWILNLGDKVSDYCSVSRVRS